MQKPHQHRAPGRVALISTPFLTPWPPHLARGCSWTRSSQKEVGFDFELAHTLSLWALRKLIFRIGIRHRNFSILSPFLSL